MKNSERVKITAARAAKFGINIGHSALVLLVFWVAMDLMQSQLRVPARNLLSSAGQTQNGSTAAALAVAMHDYGYHAKAGRLPVTENPVRPVKAVSCPVEAKVVLAKSHPRLAPVTKNPKVLVKHMLPKGYMDARGPVNSQNGLKSMQERKAGYTRVDL
jgi:hypothetical protein